MLDGLVARFIVSLWRAFALNTAPDLLSQLTSAKHIDPLSADKVRRTARTAGKLPVFVLQELGLLKEHELLAAVSALSGKPIWDQQRQKPDPAMRQRVSGAFMADRLVMPICRSNSGILAAFADPFRRLRASP